MPRDPINVVAGSPRDLLKIVTNGSPDLSLSLSIYIYISLLQVINLALSMTACTDDCIVCSTILFYQHKLHHPYKLTAAAVARQSTLN